MLFTHIAKMLFSIRLVIRTAPVAITMSHNELLVSFIDEEVEEREVS